ncbi:xanthine dehydrogenase family protein subunit M [Hyphomicrobium sp. CS1BSMeth3]|uniref:FAD binding domain-containing protein n=1 Tax=Hyphomicrobium sp. CS1BSMeth3 TaxID=1892844 RepID=UPI000930486B|nr:xanthine dehydrogenase family protein subunit M [Hyphomicrobium sp. CS1BSMeth3]
MIPFSLQKASSVGDAIAAARAGARYIAGGTTLVDLMREEVEQPDRLVDINALPLKRLQADGDDLVIGALVTMSACAAHPDVKRLQPVISEALLEGASPQLRNLATMGGNLLQRTRCPYFRMLDAGCNKRTPDSGCSAMDGYNGNHAVLGTSSHCLATHASDVAVALVALDATMQVLGPNGERTFPVEDLFRLPGTTPHLEHTLQPGELITAIRVPGGRYAPRARYLKVRDRSSYEFAVVSAAALLDLENGVIREARIACGGVGTKPWRMRACEQALAGRPADRSSFELAARLSLAGAQARSGNKFKMELMPATIVRALELARDVP